MLIIELAVLIALRVTESEELRNSAESVLKWTCEIAKLGQGWCSSSLWLGVSYHRCNYKTWWRSCLGQMYLPKRRHLYTKILSRLKMAIYPFCTRHIGNSFLEGSALFSKVTSFLSSSGMEMFETEGKTIGLQPLQKPFTHVSHWDLQQRTFWKIVPGCWIFLSGKKDKEYLANQGIHIGW